MTPPLNPAASGPTGGRLALAAAAAGYTVLVVWQAFALPDAVPGQLGAGGEVTRWGTRGEHVAMAVVTGAGMVLLCGALPTALGRLPRRLVNLPHKDYWLRPENWPRGRRMIADELGWVGAATLALVGFVLWEVGNVALGTPPPPWRLPAVLVTFVVGALVYSVTMSRRLRWRPPTP